MLRYFNESFQTFCQRGKLSNSQKLGIITCIPKPGKDKCFIKNWHPISLPNVDYKIISGVMSHRQKKVLDALISKSQKKFH
jgi:hypothetical protein